MSSVYGSLNEYGDKVQCHLCARWFRNLGLHINRGHKIECDDYRERFGLARSFKLCSSAHKQLQREQNGERISKACPMQQAKIKALTSKERSEISKIPRRKSTNIKNSDACKRNKTYLRLITPETQAKARESRLITVKSHEYRSKMAKIVMEWNADPHNEIARRKKSEKLKISCNKPEYLKKLSESVRLWHAAKKG